MSDDEFWEVMDKVEWWADNVMHWTPWSLVVAPIVSILISSALGYSVTTVIPIAFFSCVGAFVISLVVFGRVFYLLKKASDIYHNQHGE